MSRYVVKFMKNVVGGDHHEVEVCQRLFEIEAQDKSTAIEIAKRKFCEVEHLSAWSIHADRIQAAKADFPS
jgi:hypothetical protein